MIGSRIFSGHPKEEEVGYARAAVVDDWVFVSGTTGFDPQTKQYPDDVEIQCENCFRNIERALAEAGATLADLVRVLIIVAREEDFPKLMPIVRKHCYAARPTNTAIFAKLVLPEMLVEVEAVAKLRRQL
jgi:enamine deaminase RidA (YjgF/YER057c/UK114 family)